jgi:magnesium transporter
MINALDLLVAEIKKNIVLFENKNLYKENSSWKKLIALHPADIADILEQFSYVNQLIIFNTLYDELQADVFMEVSDDIRHMLFVKSDSDKREILLNRLTIDEIVDFFDDLSDEEVKNYIKLVNKKEREKVLSLLEFPETSAGGVMNSNVFVLPQKMSVAKVIYLLQRIQPEKILYRTIYVVDQKQKLMGSIQLEDLVLQKSESIIEDFMKPVEHFKNPEIDQSDVAQYMLHYKLDIIPIVSKKHVFLGIITSKTMAQVVEDEAEEDIYRMAALSPIEDTYLQTPMHTLIYQRGSILAILLLIQSISTIIIGYYESILATFLFAYIGMITSTGGNTSSQVSVLAIQGIASGELKPSQMQTFVKRELIISSCIGIFLGIIAFLRTFLLTSRFNESIIIGVALFFVVIVSTICGSYLPFILHRWKIDPAYSAGPLLATCMDIVGVILFTTVSYFLLK